VKEIEIGLKIEHDELLKQDEVVNREDVNDEE